MQGEILSQEPDDWPIDRMKEDNEKVNEERLPQYRYTRQHIYTDKEAGIECHKIFIFRDNEVVNWEYMVGNYSKEKIEEYATYLVSCHYRKLPVNWILY